MRKHLLGALGLCIALGRTTHSSAQSTAPNVAATIEVVQGQVAITTADGRTREARVGESVYVGETVSIGSIAQMQALTADHGLMVVRQQTRVVVRDFRAQGDENDAVSIELLKGALRLISGWVSKSAPKNYKIQTSTATIGIRGTDHEPLFVPPDDHPPGVEPGTYERVNEGETVLRNQHGEVAVRPGESAFSAHSPSTAPARLARLPELYRRTQMDARVDERKATVESEQEQARARRAAERREREPERPKTDSNSSQKEPSGSGAKPAENAKPEATPSKAPESSKAIPSEEGKSAERAPKEANGHEGGATSSSSTSTPHRSRREPGPKAKQ